MQYLRGLSPLSTIHYKSQIYTGVIEKLYAEQWLALEDVPIAWGKKTYSVHTEPVHPTGKEFGNSQNIEGTPLVVNVQLSARRIRELTKKLLHRYGQKSATVYLQVA